MRKVAIVIVGFNNQKDLKNCLASVKRSTYKNYFIIYVDNNSQDRSAQFVKSKYPEVKIIGLKENKGFAQANNLGVEYARKLNAQYIFLLNPDTIVAKDCLAMLIKEAQPKAVLQPIVLLYQNQKTYLVNTTGGVINYLGFSFCSNYREKISNFSSQKKIALASGAAMLVPVNIIKKIGLFDEKFFMYHEDVDFSWRCQIAGYDIMLIPQARVWHKYQFSRHRKKFYYSERNRILFLLKNYQLKLIVLIAPIFAVTELALLVYALRYNFAIAKLKSYFSVIVEWRHIKHSRSRLYKIRIKSDKMLVSMLSPNLSFLEISIPLRKPIEKLLSSYWNFCQRLL